MCSLFGIIDYGNVLSACEKNRILAVLSRECEIRGTDATGIAYNYRGAFAFINVRLQLERCISAFRVV